MKYQKLSILKQTQNRQNKQVFSSKTEYKYKYGFEKSKHYTTYSLKAFLSEASQSIKHQNRFRKNTMKNIYPVVDRNRPIRKSKHKTGIVDQSVSHA